MALLAQLARYGLVGAAVMVLYIGTTTLLGSVAGLPWALAVAGGYLLATSVHFFLQRAVVFQAGGTYALSAHEQARRWIIVVICQYVVTLAALEVVPDLLGIGETLGYLVVAAVVSVGTFVLLRTRLFHHEAEAA